MQAVKKLALEGPLELRIVEIAGVQLEVVSVNRRLGEAWPNDYFDGFALGASIELDQRMFVKQKLELHARQAIGGHPLILNRLPHRLRFTSILRVGMGEQKTYTHSRGSVDMGVAKEWASQIHERREQKKTAQEESIRVAATIANGAPRLWDQLQSEVEDMVKEFSSELPEAKYLRADRLNSNNLTVQTTAFPLIKVEVLRTPEGYLQSTVSETKHGLAETRTRRTRELIGYTLDDSGEVCFTYGARHLTAQQLAEDIMEPVVAFFKDLE